jgi:pyruvate dehydrogenase E1 component alpha subunit
MFRGITNGGWDPIARRCSLYTIVIGNQVLHAAGYAMGVQLDCTEEAVIAYFGDGATDEGDVNEAFVLGTEFHLPLVYFCENNQWAISSPRDRFNRTPLYKRAEGFGFPGVRVDGNDVLAVMAVTQAAADRARSGGGPTFVEAFTYRMGAHTTSDDPTRYRHAEELEMWRLRDPIERLKVYLARQGMADRSYFDRVDEEANELAEIVRDGVRAMQAPPPESMFEHVYAERNPVLEHQREAMAAYERSFTDEVPA